MFGIKGKIAGAINDYYGRIAQVNSELVSAAILHQKVFPPYKNYCGGVSSIAVCGAGPSLKDYSPLPDTLHIALNRAFLFDKVSFDFIFAQDYVGIRDFQQELVNYRPNDCVKFLGMQCGDFREIPESLAIKCGALRFKTDIGVYRDGYKSRFVADIDCRPLGNMPNVALAAMQLALYMNPKSLYIVGCDASCGYFTDASCKSGGTAAKSSADKREHERLLDKWRELKSFAETYYPDIEIISVNPVGLKGIFRDLYQ